MKIIFENWDSFCGVPTGKQDFIEHDKTPWADIKTILIILHKTVQ